MVICIILSFIRASSLLFKCISLLCARVQRTTSLCTHGWLINYKAGGCWLVVWATGFETSWQKFILQMQLLYVVEPRYNALWLAQALHIIWHMLDGNYYTYTLHICDILTAMRTASCSFNWKLRRHVPLVGRVHVYMCLHTIHVFMYVCAAILFQKFR